MDQDEVISLNLRLMIKIENGVTNGNNCDRHNAVLGHVSISLILCYSVLTKSSRSSAKAAVS
jgi:hypothetical protein